MAGLNERQRKFVGAYLECGNATKAYKQAGYETKPGRDTENAASRLLGNVEVANAIREAQKQAAVDAQVNAAWVLASLKTEAQDRGKGSSHAARISALHLIGKHLRMFDDQPDPNRGTAAILVVEVVRSAPVPERPVVHLIEAPPHSVQAAEPTPGELVL